MDDLRRMAIFAAVVEQRSMSAAARALHMSTSAVSQQVRALESSGGVTLLHRTTRKLALTDAGERFYAECAGMVAAARRAQAELALSRDAPSGELRLSATVGFARHISPAPGGRPRPGAAGARGRRRRSARRPPAAGAARVVAGAAAGVGGDAAARRAAGQGAACGGGAARLLVDAARRVELTGCAD